MNNQRPVRVADAMRSSAFSVDENVPARNILAAMESAHVDELPVVAPDGLFRAMVDRRVVERQQPLRPVRLVSRGMCQHVLEGPLEDEQP